MKIFYENDWFGIVTIHGDGVSTYIKRTALGQEVARYSWQFDRRPSELAGFDQFRKNISK